MSKLVNWGRWPVAMFFALQGLAILVGAVTFAILALRDRSSTLYPTYRDVLVSSAFLLCSWGLVTMRRWAYSLAMGICLFESLTIVILFAKVGAKVFEVNLITGGLHLDFDSGSILISVMIAFACIVWLCLPSVRAQYLQKDFPA